MIYQYYVYQNDETINRKLPDTLGNEDVLYQYRNLESELKDWAGESSEVVITDSSRKIGVLVSIDSNKTRDEVGCLLGESIQRLNSQTPRLYLSARYMEG